MQPAPVAFPEHARLARRIGYHSPPATAPARGRRPVRPARRMRFRPRLRTAFFAVVAAAAAAWFAFLLIQPLPPRTIVIASGVKESLFHRYAQQYVALLAEQGVEVRERMTSGAADNYRLLLDRGSGVDVAFMQGGIASLPEAEHLDMLASLYVEPLFIFHRGDAAPTRINQFKGKRLAVGIAGGGTNAFLKPILSANGITAANSTLLETEGSESIRQLEAGEVDAIFLLGGANSPMIQQALHEPAFRLMSLGRADAYSRRWSHIDRYTLPPGAISFERDIPAQDVSMIGTKAMLVARDDVHPALVNLLIDAAREIHGHQGVFEDAGEFPGTARVDIPVSSLADQHRRFGPSYLYRILPFWAAALVERLIVLLIPLAVLIVPLVNLLPRMVRWRWRTRLVRWYGQLALLERDLAIRQGEPPVRAWLERIDDLSRAVGQARTPAAFASEMFTLREHIELVRREILAKR